MKLTNTPLADLIWQFGQKFVQQYEKNMGHIPLAEHDEQWPSPCQQKKIDDDVIQWLPVKTSEDLTFENVENALELTLHDDIKTYFTAMYSDAVHAKSEDGYLSLLFPWSENDFQRLQENIIGHVLMKQKLKQAITVFFALTDQDDFILSIINETGEVWVEKVGCDPHKKVANSLADFITSLTPYVETIPTK